MKHVKKILAFALTLVMAFAIALPAFAEGDNTTGNTGNAGSRTVDEKISVTGLEKGDTVTAYQFITWNDTSGWVLAENITGIKLDDITGVNGPKELTAAQLATLANQTDKMTRVTGEFDAAGTTWEMECGDVDKAGSYLILVTSGTVEYVYNPAVVSADFDGENGTVTLTNDEARIKKQPISVDKVADNATAQNNYDDYDVQVGDIVPFTVTVTVPQYNTNWDEPTFEVTDTLSPGLTIETAPVLTVGEGNSATNLEEGENKDYTITNGNPGDNGFTIQFTDNYLKNNASAAVNIKYSAKVGEAVQVNEQIHEETNKVKLVFSNNPANSSNHKDIEKETHHYTFAIDATRFGQNSEVTNELIKVGVDDAGNTINKVIEGEVHQNGVSPLADAEFTLTGIGPNGKGTTTLKATSDETGHVYFNNLEAGTYTLQETKAPTGYVKDNTTHEVVIAAEYNKDTTLKKYTITIDGETTSTYTATTDADNVTTYTTTEGGNPSFVIANAKGTELPSTGGIGTTIFYVVGGVMVGGAAIFLLTKRRAASAE